MLQATLFVFCSFLIGIAPGKVNAQSVNKSRVGKGVQFVAADTSFSLRLNARVQTLYMGVQDLQEDSYSDRFLVRRARLKMEGFAYHPNLEYKIELGLSNSDIGGGISREFNNTANIILDAVLRWQFAPNFEVWFGQTKLPGNRERVISSQKLQFVDRSLLNSSYNIDRDAGVQLHHTFSAGNVVFREMLALSMGEGRNIAVDNRGGYEYTGRVEVLPFGEFTADGDYFGADLAREKTPKLSVGVSYDYNDRASRQGGQLGSFFDQERTLKAFFADAMFKYRGFSAMAEYADKESVGTPVVETNEFGSVTRAFQTGTGFNIQAGYVFKNNYEIAGRYTSINAELLTQRDDLRQYTLGLSKYIAGHTVKVQSDISLLRAEEINNELMYRFQVEIGF
ncbi:porin [Cesiribacter sp. SM1]|uniref:porin n=1 Tax=Cesiribacter sp. SM1 TaxID=2861196 RepID=UPI001CD70FAC|nr:porin [Cesiribacter sp. SM1]